MSKQKQTQPINSTKGAQYLIEYRTILKDKVLSLRAEACNISAKVRELDKLITEETIQEVEEQKVADQSWSMNNGALANFKPVVQASLTNGK